MIELKTNRFYWMKHKLKTKWNVVKIEEIGLSKMKRILFFESQPQFLSSIAMDEYDFIIIKEPH